MSRSCGSCSSFKAESDSSFADFLKQEIVFFFGPLFFCLRCLFVVFCLISFGWVWGLGWFCCVLVLVGFGVWVWVWVGLGVVLFSHSSLVSCISVFVLESFVYLGFFILARFLPGFCLCVSCCRLTRCLFSNPMRPSNYWSVSTYNSYIVLSRGFSIRMSDRGGSNIPTRVSYKKGSFTLFRSDRLTKESLF